MNYKLETLSGICLRSDRATIDAEAPGEMVPTTLRAHFDDVTRDVRCTLTNVEKFRSIRDEMTLRTETGAEHVRKQNDMLFFTDRTSLRSGVAHVSCCAHQFGMRVTHIQLIQSTVVKRTNDGTTRKSIVDVTEWVLPFGNALDHRSGYRHCPTRVPGLRDNSIGRQRETKSSHRVFTLSLQSDISF